MSRRKIDHVVPIEQNLLAKKEKKVLECSEPVKKNKWHLYNLAIIPLSCFPATYITISILLTLLKMIAHLQRIYFI